MLPQSGAPWSQTLVTKQAFVARTAAQVHLTTTEDFLRGKSTRPLSIATVPATPPIVQPLPAPLPIAVRAAGRLQQAVHGVPRERRRATQELSTQDQDFACCPVAGAVGRQPPTRGGLQPRIKAGRIFNRIGGCGAL